MGCMRQKQIAEVTEGIAFHSRYVRWQWYIWWSTHVPCYYMQTGWLQYAEVNVNMYAIAKLRVKNKKSEGIGQRGG